MVNYQFKNELIRSGFKTYMSVVKDCDYNFLPDEIIEKIMKYVNQPNILIISNMNFIKEEDYRYYSKKCKYCKCEMSDTKATPCPLKYLNPKYPEYIEDDIKRMKFIEKIKSKKYKKWNHHNIIITKDNLLLNFNIKLKWTKVHSKCICNTSGCWVKKRHNRRYKLLGYKYEKSHNLIMCNIIENEKIFDNVFKFL